MGSQTTSLVIHSIAFIQRNPLLCPIQVSYLLCFWDLDTSSQTHCCKPEMFHITQKKCCIFGFQAVLLNVNDFDSAWNQFFSSFLQFPFSSFGGKSWEYKSAFPPFGYNGARCFLHSLHIRSLDHLFFSSVFSSVLKAELWESYLHRKWIPVLYFYLYLINCTYNLFIMA